MSNKVSFVNGATLYNDEDVAQLQTDFMAEGVADTTGSGTDCQVSQRAAGGANMSVDIAIGRVYVDITWSARAFKTRFSNYALANAVVAANSTGGDRIDAALVVIDTTVTPNAAGDNIGTLSVLTNTTGTPTVAISDGDITTLLGHANWYRLANITVANGATSITNANITDTRQAVAWKNVFSVFELIEQAANPAAVANRGKIYSKDVAGRTELHYLDDAGNVIQITSNGSINVSAADEKVKISNADTTADYLFNKATATNGIILTKINPAGNEQLQISTPGFVRSVVLGEAMTAGDPARFTNNAGTLNANPISARDLNTLTMDTESTAFASGAPNYLKASWIGTNKLVLVFQDGATGYMKAVVGTYVKATNTWTWGSVATLVAGSGAAFIYLCKVDTDKFAITYRDGNYSSRLDLMVCSVSGTTITAGSAVAVYSGALSRDMIQLGANKIVISYYDQASSHGRLRIATISGTTPTLGTELDFHTPSTSINTIELAKLDTDKFAVMYDDDSNSDGRIFNCTVSGTTITSWKANQVSFETGALGVDNMSACQAATDKAILCWTDGTDILSCIVSFAGDTPTVNAEAVVLASNQHQNKSVIAPLSTNEFVIFYRKNAATYNQMKVLSVAGNTITVNAANSANANCTSASFRGVREQSGDTTLVAAANASNAGNTAICAAVDLTVTVTAGGYSGICGATGAAGDTKDFYLPGAISPNHSGLTPGADQWIDDATGALTETPQTVRAGRAFSATEILVLPEFT